jgi:hypothetical protein
MNFRQPLHPVLQNILILAASGLIASVICAKAYGATLPVDEPTVISATVASAPAPALKANDDAAAAMLRAMLKGGTPLVGTGTLSFSGAAPVAGGPVR